MDRNYELGQSRVRLGQGIPDEHRARASCFYSYAAVDQAASSEWPWLHGVKHRFKQQPLVPLERKVVARLLTAEWEGSWGEAKQVKPPAQNAADLLDYLIELGILKVRTDDRINVPDLYLFGLGLRRKGGVRVS